ncbi:MAG: helix-turn-helix domain-containing protein [Pseudomonadota bacterium]
MLVLEMGRPLSMDLRARALAAVDAGLSRRAAARRFGVGVSSVIRWDAARRATGSFAPKAQGGDTRSQRIEARSGEVMAALEEQRDQTLVELCERLAARGISTSKSSLARFFQRRGITRKRMARPVGKWVVSGSVRSCANLSGVAALCPSP